MKGAAALLEAKRILGEYRGSSLNVRLQTGLTTAERRGSVREKRSKRLGTAVILERCGEEQPA